MPKMYPILILTFLLLTSQFAFAQKIEPGSFYFPIKPGQQNYLSATMGELRSNHFHAGIDIKTDRKIGLNVHAAEQGYIYRVKISPWGYGRALYMRHPSGHVTVYAHLDAFDEQIEKWATEQQYAKEQFDVDLYPPKGKFTFQKGDVIAKGGNSGSSSAPHLHFEIRNAQEVPLNPMEADFKELVDDQKPVISKISLTTHSPEARIMGRYGRCELDVSGSGDYGKLDPTIEAYGRIGLEFIGHDVMNGTTNVYGINKVQVWIDGRLWYMHEINAIPFDVKRQINVFTDEEYYRISRRKYQRCYVHDGNSLRFYKNYAGDGRFDVEDGKTYQVEMRFWDGQENRAMVRFEIKGNKNAKAEGKDYKLFFLDNYHIFENMMLIQAKTLTQKAIIDTKEGKNYSLDPIYQVGEYSAYLYDMRRGLPLSVTAGPTSRSFSYHALAPSTKDFVFWGGWLDVHIPQGALYDTLWLELQKNGNSYQIGNPNIPLHQHIDITLKDLNLSYADKKYSSVYLVADNGRKSRVGGTWEGQNIKFRTRDLGRFQVLKDLDKPEIRLIKADQNGLKFRISDKLSGVDTYRAEVDGQFLLMEYESGYLTSKLKPGQTSIKGDFKLTVTDGQGNASTYTTRIP